MSLSHATSHSRARLTVFLSHLYCCASASCKIFSSTSPGSLLNTRACVLERHHGQHRVSQSVGRLRPSPRACRFTWTRASAAMQSLREVVLPHFDVPPDVHTSGCTSCLHLRRHALRQPARWRPWWHLAWLTTDFSSAQTPGVMSFVLQKSCSTCS